MVRKIELAEKTNAPPMSLHSAKTVKILEVTPGKTPAWPPPPRPRPHRSRVSLVAQVSAIVLALLLVISGLVFIIYSATVGYHGTLRAVATSEARATQYVVGTAQAQQQATAQTLSTAQAYINTTATAQTIQAAQATAAIDNATATATSLSDLLTQATGKTPTLDDSLSDNSGTGKWDEGNTINTSVASTGCAFKDGVYHVTEAQQGFLQPCIAENTDFSNFVYQVQVTLDQGNQGQAGLLFQVDSTNKAYYFFYIGSDGSYELDLYSSSGQVTTLTRSINAAITTGLGQSNQLSVLAKNGTYYLYANGQYLVTVTNTSLSSGKIGLAVVNQDTPVDAEFSAVQVWKL
jgi:3-keto-disaccharide hydrolase